MAEEQQKKEQWSEVECEGLAVCLAENDWKIQTKNVHSDDLWEMSTIVDPVTHEVELVKEVRPFWAGTFWGLKESYDILIEQFKRKE